MKTWLWLPALNFWLAPHPFVGFLHDIHFPHDSIFFPLKLINTTTVDAFFSFLHDCFNPVDCFYPLVEQGHFFVLNISIYFLKMLHSFGSLLNRKFSQWAASEPAATLTRSSVNFCLMKNGSILEVASFAVIASSVIVLSLYNSLWTNRGSGGRLEPPHLELPSTHHPCPPPPGGLSGT